MYSATKFFNCLSRTPTVKTVKTTQGHLAIMKSRNRAYEVRFVLYFISATQRLSVFLIYLSIFGVRHIESALRTLEPFYEYRQSVT